MQGLALIYVTLATKLTYMKKTQVYLRDEELDALRQAATRSGRSVADLIRDAIRKTVLAPGDDPLVAIWNGPTRGDSTDHDSAFDEL